MKKQKQSTTQLNLNALEVLKRRYLLRNERGETVETPEDLFWRVAKTMAEAEKMHGGNAQTVDQWAERFYNRMASLEFLPNTPCLINAGARLGQLSACFVVEIRDSLDSIFSALSAAAKIHQSGGGTGFSFSEIRPKDDLIASTGRKSSGPVSFMKIFDVATETMKQGGVRRGANMGVLRVDHPDILEFITMKSDPTAFKNFNVSVGVTDAFMRAVLANKSYALINPRTKKTVTRLNARDVFNLITENAWKTGDPGLVFLDEMNRKNPTGHLGPISATNPCGEVPLHPWESCNLGSLNLTRFVEGEPLRAEINWGKLRDAIRDAVRFLDNMIDVSRFPLPQIEKATRANRRIGLGVMGFAEMLILLGIPYSSDRALKTADRLARFIENESVKVSENLGRERGSFPNFKGSHWQKSGKKWMRNATTTVIAPTGTISIIAGCSSGIEPLFAVSFIRNILEGERLIESNPLFERIAKARGFLSTDLLMEIARTGSVRHSANVLPAVKKLFVTALEIPVKWHIRMQSVFQKHTHSAVSKTINLPMSATVKDVRDAYLLAWKLKCKGITVYRYGSKPAQVLTIGAHVAVDAEFAGGCPGGVCSETTT